MNVIRVSLKGEAQCLKEEVLENQHKKRLYDESRGTSIKKYVGLQVERCINETSCA
jgi:hypothetical protein